MIERSYERSRSRTDPTKKLSCLSPSRKVTTGKECGVLWTPQLGEASIDITFPAHQTMASKLGEGGSQATCFSPLVSLRNGNLACRDGSQCSDHHTRIEQLRNRLLTGGHTVMVESELLELLLEGAVLPKQIRPLTQRLLSVFGHLSGIVAASKHRVLTVPGSTPEVYLRLQIAAAIAHRMGQAKVLKREVLSCWKDLITYCRTTMAHRDTEQFRIFFLDRRNTIIADEEQGSGTVDHVPVYPREVAKRALELNASALILIHNHPSGDPAPSNEDICMTQRILSACETIDVTIHDHVVIGKGTEFSFKAEGYLARCTVTK